MSDEAPITITVKFGKDFDAPWLVTRANTPQQAAEQLGVLSPEAAATASQGDLLTAIAVAARVAQGKYNASALANPSAPVVQQPAPPAPQPAQQQTMGWGGQQPPQPQQWTQPAQQAWGGQPQQAPQQAAPQQQTYGSGAGAPGPAPSCQHGVKTYREGVGKTGRPYKAWFCPAPRGTVDQCQPEFIR